MYLPLGPPRPAGSIVVCETVSNKVVQLCSSQRLKTLKTRKLGEGGGLMVEAQEMLHVHVKARDAAIWRYMSEQSSTKVLK